MTQAKGGPVGGTGSTTMAPTSPEMIAQGDESDQPENSAAAGGALGPEAMPSSAATR